MILKDLENLSDEEKISNFDVLLDYTKELQRKHLENLVLRHRMKENNEKYLKEQEKLLKQEIDEEVKKRVSENTKDFKRRKVKEMDKEESRKIYLTTIKDIQKEKWGVYKAKAQIRAEIMEELAQAQLKKHPMLNLTSTQWKSRLKIYPKIMAHPEKSTKTIALELWTSSITVEQAKNELIASWEILNNKIDLVKRIVTRAALTTEKAQEVLLKRLTKNPNSIANKDLISAIKNNAALYSLFVGQATTSYWWIVEQQDQKLLDDILDDNLD